MVTQDGDAASVARSRHRILDVCCCAGAASWGYWQAGFDPEGIDIKPQPNYRFPFTQASLLDLDPQEIADGYDAIHLSPPCQPDSAMSNCRPGLADTYERLIEPARELAQATGLPYVIENVVGSALIDPTMLCGFMFGRQLYRHRLFETSFPLPQPEHPAHTIPASKAGHWRPGTIMSVAGHVSPIKLAREVMEIDWTTRDELAEAIPPYYTGRWEAMWEARGPLVECDPWGAQQNGRGDAHV
jgi:DNA (cytosine-5)-methyltransferase 1